jgi:hypothetical protein
VPTALPSLTPPQLLALSPPPPCRHPLLASSMATHHLSMAPATAIPMTALVLQQALCEQVHHQAGTRVTEARHQVTMPKTSQL